MSRPFRLGVVVNPVAGIGGPAALKGSDGDAARIAAHAAYRSQSTGRMARALATVTQSCEVYTLLGAMGADACDEAGLPAHVHAGAAARATTSADTRAGVRVLQGICDLILFAGGDGTARDVLDALDTDCPVLGVPAGVKMHSGVFGARRRRPRTSSPGSCAGRWLVRRVQRSGTSMRRSCGMVR